MPLLLGFQSTNGGATFATTAAGRRVLTAFAQAEGYALAEIFLDGGAISPASTIAALIQAVRVKGAVAVAVPTAVDLGRSPDEQQLMLQRIQEGAEVPVLIVQQNPIVQYTR